MMVTSQIGGLPFPCSKVTSVGLAAWTGAAFEMQNEFNGLGGFADKTGGYLDPMAILNGNMILNSWI